MRLLLCALASVMVLSGAASAADQPFGPPSMTPPLEGYVPFEGSALGDTCDCIDLVLVIDDTGSMGGTIANVKAGIVSLISLADDIACGDLQAGLISFADFPQVDQALTFNTAAVVAAVNALAAGGGAALPEASDEAMRLAIVGSNNCNGATFNVGDYRDECCKVVILATDALPGGCDDAYTGGVDDVNAHNAALAAAAAGIKIGAIQVQNNFVPFTGIMQDYASTTGGTWGLTALDGSGAAAAVEAVIRSCSDTPDPELVPCCGPTGCFLAFADDCVAGGGIVVASCTRPDCPTPTSPSSWGAIKANYHR